MAETITGWVVLMQRTYRAFRILFCVCFLLIAASVLLRSGLFLAVACICLGFYWLSRHHIPRFTVWLFLGGILVRFVVIWVLHPPLESDFEKLLRCGAKSAGRRPVFNSTPIFPSGPIRPRLFVGKPCGLPFGIIPFFGDRPCIPFCWHSMLPVPPGFYLMSGNLRPS